jgi:hypothetical protein
VWQALRAVASRFAWWQPPASGPVRSPPRVCRSGIMSASATAAASQASLRAGRARRHFPIPSVAAAAASRRAPAATLTRAHTRGACVRTPYRTASACRAGVTGRQAPAPARQPPPSGTVAAARLPQRHLVGQRDGRRVAGSLRAGRARRHFSRSQCGSRRQSCRAPAATLAGAGGGSRSAGARALRADTRPSPHARRPSGCRHAAPAKRPCKLPRQLSAECLARAFAPRRATSGLVRHPPASDANRGEGRSLVDG